MKINIPNKKVQISKAQSTTIIMLSVAIVVSVFSLVSAKRLWSEAIFQRHVVNARRQSAQALQNDVSAAHQLIQNSSQVFTNQTKADNVLGGRNTTSSKVAPPDGDNARLVLDALPSNYDFPALITSLTKIMSRNGITNPGIS